MKPAGAPTKQTCGQLFRQPYQVMNIYSAYPMWESMQLRTHGKPGLVIGLSYFQPTLQHLGSRSAPAYYQQIPRLRQIAGACIQAVKPGERTFGRVKRFR